MDLALYSALGNTFLIGERSNNETRLYLMNKYHVDGFIIYNNIPLSMRVFNRDGSEASMCGNGIRCFLEYGVRKGYLNKGIYYVKTSSGTIRTEIVSLDPFYCYIYLCPERRIPIHKKILTIDSYVIPLYDVIVGTKCHVVNYNQNVNKENVIKRIYHLYPKRDIGNIGFVRILSRKEIEVLTYERGVGYTSSCGTSNASAFYVFNSKGLLDADITCKNLKGNMELSLVSNCVLLKGDATFIDEVSYE